MQDDVVERARHEMSIFDRPSKRTSEDMIATILSLREQLEKAREVVREMADAYLKDTPA